MIISQPAVCVKQSEQPVERQRGQRVHSLCICSLFLWLQLSPVEWDCWEWYLGTVTTLKTGIAGNWWLSRQYVVLCSQFDSSICTVDYLKILVQCWKMWLWTTDHMSLNIHDSYQHYHRRQLIYTLQMHTTWARISVHSGLCLLSLMRVSGRQIWPSNAVAFTLAACY